MSQDQPPRRSSHVEMPVAYAAVGASKDPDVVKYPPEGTTPYEEELRLGSGQDRFLIASSLLMTWGAQRGSGVRVTDIVRGTGSEYVGPSFDGDGKPEAAGDVEEQFGPDGEPYIVAGTTAVLHAEGQDPRSVLVVYTVDEERRVGFAWGTGDEAGAVGEQLFVIEHRADDTVWAVARGFVAAPKNGLLGLRGRADVRTALDAVKRGIAALAPGAQPAPDLGPSAGEQPVAVEPAAEPEPDPAAAPAPQREPAPDEAPAPEAAPAGEPEADSGDAATGPTHQRRPSKRT
ncbi:DUF1990 family protein [Leucobacter chromiiresistens]|uniref:Uncharacterized protein, UPF0548 family n=2 Tax=Leucobacter chromiiresistens TaxID=1079994 RepID=A0A1H1A4X3_9MICO|nr:DUF1990 family protein [Leucobacter chromiiresistens]SDQ34707.1 Uncharacterized protein, UPF0548 family [Leucobacter chromiiresistens]